MAVASSGDWSFDFAADFDDHLAAAFVVGAVPALPSFHDQDSLQPASSGREWAAQVGCVDRDVPTGKIEKQGVFFDASCECAAMLRVKMKVRFLGHPRRMHSE
jgi:hypothetical protein